MTGSNLPSLEVQTSYLFNEMGTSDGGNIANTYYNNPSWTASQSAVAFENQFERSGGSAVTARINNANNVYNAYSSGNLSSLPSNAQYIFNQAISRGYTPAQAAGIVGNLQAESGQNIDPNAYNPAGGGQGANGIAQWRAGRYSNLLAYDPATGEVIPNTEVQAGDINPVTGEPLTAPEAQAVREEAQATNQRRRVGSLYQDNQLNQFDSYTYNWSVHIFHPLLVGQYSSLSEILESEQAITLAQSGVENEISIDRVEQDMVLTFAKENRSSVANVFSIDFIEPAGLTFYTRIFKAAQNLGIENHLEACYLLELNFKGWRGDTATTIDPYFYQTKLIKLSMNFRDGASFYKGDFIETQEDAYARLNLHLNQQITISASTFGDFLTQFETKVNEQAKLATIASRTKLLPNRYHFGTEPDAEEWKSYKFDAVEGDKLESTRGVSVSVSGGTLNITISQGTSITSAIAMALFQTAQFKKILTTGGVAKEYSASPVADENKLAELVKWVTFKTDVKYWTYDYLYKHYAKDITFNVKSYIAPEATHDPASQIGLMKYVLQEDRLREIFDRGLLRKKFDYYLTGLNTEVLSLDLSLNNVFYQIQALNHGYVAAPDEIFVGNGGSQQREVSSKIRTAAQLTEQVKKIDNDISILKEKQRIQSENSSGPTEANVYTAQIKNLQAQKDEIRNIAGRQGSISDAAHNQFIADAYAQQANATSLPSAANRYITQSELSTPASFKDFLPNNFDYTQVDSLATSGPENGNNVGAAMLGAVEMNLNATGDLMQQSLMIRGDPYWLGRPKGFNGAETQADYETGGVAYFLNVNLPTYPDESTGLAEVTGNFMITGLYRVVRVRASYSDGQFIMTLESFRDVNTDSQAMMENLIAGNVPPKRVSNAPTNNRDRQNETENNPQVDEDGDGVPDTELADGVTGSDSTGNHRLADNVNPDLNNILSAAGDASGVTVVTTSGNRGEGGSGRHAGDASDVALYSGGRQLSVSNAADRAIIQTFTQNYVSLSRQNGYTPSVGWANHTYSSNQWYMGGNHGHYDIAVGNSIGSNRGTIWGGSGRTAHVPPPSWLRTVMSQ